MMINEMTSIEGHRSQGARMVFVTDGALWNGDKGLHSSHLVGEQPRSEGMSLHHTGRGLHTALSPNAPTP